MRYKKNVGDAGEQFAADMMESAGYRIVERNYSVKGGEIDIIAIKDGVMHFVEVKTRTSLDYGYPSDAVTESKQKKMKAAAHAYLASRRGHWENISFDVYEVLTNHIEDFM